ncbi:hypothetical protein [Paenibacillus sp. LjRoot56]
MPWHNTAFTLRSIWLITLTGHFSSIMELTAAGTRLAAVVRWSNGS